MAIFYIWLSKFSGYLSDLIRLIIDGQFTDSIYGLTSVRTESSSYKNTDLSSIGPLWTNLNERWFYIEYISHFITFQYDVDKMAVILFSLRCVKLIPP